MRHGLFVVTTILIVLLTSSLASAVPLSSSVNDKEGDVQRYTRAFFERGQVVNGYDHLDITYFSYNLDVVSRSFSTEMGLKEIPEFEGTYYSMSLSSVSDFGFRGPDEDDNLLDIFLWFAISNGDPTFEYGYNIVSYDETGTYRDYYEGDTVTLETVSYTFEDTTIRFEYTLPPIFPIEFFEDDSQSFTAGAVSSQSEDGGNVWYEDSVGVISEGQQGLNISTPLRTFMVLFSIVMIIGAIYLVRNARGGINV